MGNKRIIIGNFVLTLSFFCNGQTAWRGNYLIDQNYPKKMPSEVRKDLWGRLEVSEDKSNDKLIWKYSSRQFSSFCAMIGYAKGTDDSLALFFEKYDSCTSHGKTSPSLTTPYLILKRENEKYFVCEAQMNGKKYSLITKQNMQ